MSTIKLYTKLGNFITKDSSLCKLQYYTKTLDDGLYVHNNHKQLIIYVNNEPRCLSILNNLASKYGKDSNNIWHRKEDLVRVIINSQGNISILNKNTSGLVINNGRYYLNRTLFNLLQGSNESSSRREQRTLFGYHSGRGRENLIGDSIYGIGIEVEKEDGSLTINCENLLSSTKWTFERDGSLNEHGFELISPALPFKVFGNVKGQTDWIEKYIKPVEQYLSSEGSHRCGNHFHLSCKDKTPDELLDSISGYLPLLYAMYPDRVKNNFCRALKKDNYKEMRGHGVAVNVKSNTLELRIFPLLKDTDDLIFRLELIRYMLKYQSSEPRKVFKKVFKEDSYLSKHMSSKYDLTELARLFSKFCKEIEEIDIA